MAAIAQEQTVKVTINGIELDVPKNELIVESVKRLGLEVPIFCYHPRLKPVGMCRMCLVEVGFKQQDGSVRMMPKPQAACTLPASEGMVVLTESEAVHTDRKGVLEFLLINHPLDCPICDRGGECPLQNNTMAYGPSTSRFIEMKRHLPKAYPLSKYVTLDLERCIQCGRCVRFTEEISGDSQLAFRFRGADMQPSTFKLTDFESKFSGNVIEICPVGALTSAKYRFRARPWDLETGPAVCTLTPCGTNIWFDHRAGKFVRVNGRTNEAVNEEWTCDRSKFGYEFYNDPTRLTAPNVRSGDSFERSSWGDAITAVVDAAKSAGGGSTAVIVGETVSNETAFTFAEAFQTQLGCDTVASGMTLAPSPLAGDMVQTTIASMEGMDAVLVFGTSLADEQPMHYLRLRKAWFNSGCKVVVAHSEPTDADSFAHTVLRYKTGSEAWFAAGLAAAMGEAGNLAKACEQTGLTSAEFEAAAKVLSAGQRAFLTTSSLLNAAKGTDATQILAGLAAKHSVQFSQLGLQCNSFGTRLLAKNPVADVLKNAAAGNTKVLVLVDADPLRDFPDKDLAAKALEAVETLVFIGALPTDSAAYATHVLPMALPAEDTGTFTSSEGRVQRISKLLTAPGEAKPGWRIATELALAAGATKPGFNPAEVFDRLAKSTPEFEGLSYSSLPGDGALLPRKAGDSSGLAQTLASYAK